VVRGSRSAAAGVNRIALITDAMEATGMGNGRYKIGNLEVDVKDGLATLAHGTHSIAGSTLTMDVAYRNAVQAGVSLVDASRMASDDPGTDLRLVRRRLDRDREAGGPGAVRRRVRRTEGDAGRGRGWTDRKPSPSTWRWTSRTRVDELQVGGSHRVDRIRRRAGGKGVNVARVAATLGHQVLVLGFVGGVTGELVAEELFDAGLTALLTPIAGETRRTVAIVNGADGDATIFNEAGPSVTGDEWARVAGPDAVGDGLGVLACSGSLPVGLPADAYAEDRGAGPASRTYCPSSMPVGPCV